MLIMQVQPLWDIVKTQFIASSHMIHEITSMAIEFGDPLVTTVGKIEPYPSIVNVVPGKVIFTLDVRHTDERSSPFLLPNK